MSLKRLSLFDSVLGENSSSTQGKARNWYLSSSAEIIWESRYSGYVRRGTCVTRELGSAYILDNYCFKLDGPRCQLTAKIVSGFVVLETTSEEKVTRYRTDTDAIGSRFLV